MALQKKMKVVGEGWDAADFHARFRPVVDQMLADRGRILNSYAQVEFLAADIAVRSRVFPDYSELMAKPVDFGLGNRVKRLRLLCEAGPLAAHADAILPVMDRLLELEETRHTLTHGFMTIHIQSDGQRIAAHFQQYVQPKKGSLETWEEWIVLPEELAAACQRWTLFAQTAVTAFRDVYAALGFDRSDITKGYPKRFRF